MVGFPKSGHICLWITHGLIDEKFTITHPSVVAVTTTTQVHMPLSSTVIEVVNRVICYRLSRVIVIEETSQVSELRVLKNSRVSHKVMSCKRTETQLY